MSENQKIKSPSTLSQYLRLKAKEHKLSERQLSKLIIPGSSGSLIAYIRFDETKVSEKKIKKIANYFNDDHFDLTFMSGRIPKIVYDLIIREKDIQSFLLSIVKKQNVKENK